MKIILIADVDKLGKVGDAKEVAPGYAKNFLLTKELAVLPGDVRAKQAGLKTKSKKRKVHREKESKREKRLKRQSLKK